MSTGGADQIEDGAASHDRPPRGLRREQLMTIFADAGLEVIEPDECLRILQGVSVARVGVTSGALPVVLPVHIAVASLGARTDPEVIMRCVGGSKLCHALTDAVIAVQADAIDPMSHAGWSVLVRGRTRVVVDAAERAMADRLPLQTWSSTLADCFIAVGTEVVTGGRIVPWLHGPVTPRTV